MDNEVLEFYKKTSCYTDLGLYKCFAINLPDDVKELSLLIRNQIIHPFVLCDEKERLNKNSFYGDMTKVEKTSLNFENDLYPSAIAMIAELLRRDSEFSCKRKIEDKIHVCCREHSILLTSILKAKGIPSRVRSGFANYVSDSTSSGDHWISEYYSYRDNRWILIDSDMYLSESILEEYGIDFNLLDMPKEKFIYSADAYLKLRSGEYNKYDVYYASKPYIYGMKAALRALFYDYHSLMNDEITFLYMPKYILKKNFELSEEEFIELDILARLMLDPDKNFKELRKIWETVDKYRIMAGGINGY